MKCKFCSRPVEWVRPRRQRNELRDNYRWLCNHCGRHELNGDKQLTIREVELRKLKREAHTLLDYYWMVEGHERKYVNSRIRKVLGINKDEGVHMSNMNEAQLRKLIQRVKEGNFLWHTKCS